MEFNLNCLVFAVGCWAAQMFLKVSVFCVILVTTVFWINLLRICVGILPAQTCFIS